MKVIQAVLMHTVLTCCASVTYMEEFDSLYSWRKRLHSRLSAYPPEKRKFINQYVRNGSSVAFNFFFFFLTFMLLSFHFSWKKKMIFLYEIFVISYLLH